MDTREARYNPLSGEVGGIETPEVSPEEVEKNKFKTVLVNKLRDIISEHPERCYQYTDDPRIPAKKAELGNKEEARVKLQGAEPVSVFGYNEENEAFRIDFGLGVSGRGELFDSKGKGLNIESSKQAYDAAAEISKAGAELFLKDQIRMEIAKLTERLDAARKVREQEDKERRDIVERMKTIEYVQSIERRIASLERVSTTENIGKELLWTSEAKYFQ